MKNIHKLLIAIFCQFPLWLIFAGATLIAHPAYAENQLRILVWDQGYLPVQQRKYFEAFIERKYDYKVTIVPKIIQSPDHIFHSLRLGEVELATPTHNLVEDPRFKMIENQLILPIDVEKIENFDKVIDVLKHYFRKADKYYGIPFIFGPYGLIYNTDKFESAPIHWDILWNPLYKNKYAVSYEHYEANAYIAALSLGYKESDLVDFETLSKDARFVKRYKELALNAGAMWKTDNGGSIQGYPFSMSWGFALPELKSMGETWKLSIMEEGVTGWMDPYVISHTLKNKPMLKKIAEEWVNFSLSNDYQIEAVIRQLSSFPVIKNIKPMLNAEEVQTYRVDEPEFVKSNLILWPVLPKRTRNGFKNLWDDALKEAEGVAILK